MRPNEGLFLGDNRQLLPDRGQGLSSHLNGKCKCVEQLRLCRCWADLDRVMVSVTVRLVSFWTMWGLGSPWHSGASLPSCRVLAPREASVSVGGASPDLANGDDRRRKRFRWRRRRYGQPPSSSVSARATALSGTPGSDHVVELGKARRMPKTVTRSMCRCHVSGIDLTLARRIGRIWTRPGRGNISLLGGKGQFVRTDGAVNLCAVRRSGRATTHTSSGLRLDAPTFEHFARDDRAEVKWGRGRASLGAR